MRTLLPIIALVLVSCGDDRCEAILCEPCAPALTLELHDGQGNPIPDVTVEGVEMSCGESTDATVCSTVRGRAGNYEVTIRAPGFHEHVIDTNVPEVTSGGCCSCGYEPLTLRINLTRAN